MDTLVEMSEYSLRCAVKYIEQECDKRGITSCLFGNFTNKNNQDMMLVIFENPKTYILLHEDFKYEPVTLTETEGGLFCTLILHMEELEWIAKETKMHVFDLLGTEVFPSPD